jgi:hypothetical protein
MELEFGRLLPKADELELKVLAGLTLLPTVFKVGLVGNFKSASFAFVER